MVSVQKNKKGNRWLVKGGFWTCSPGSKVLVQTCPKDKRSLGECCWTAILIPLRESEDLPRLSFDEWMTQIQWLSTCESWPHFGSNDPFTGIVQDHGYLHRYLHYDLRQQQKYSHEEAMKITLWLGVSATWGTVLKESCLSLVDNHCSDRRKTFLLWISLNHGRGDGEACVFWNVNII